VRSLLWWLESGCFVNRAQTSAGKIIWFSLADRKDVKQELLKDVKELAAATAVFLTVDGVCSQWSQVK
jgi:cytochrome c556